MPGHSLSLNTGWRLQEGPRLLGFLGASHLAHPADQPGMGREVKEALASLRDQQEAGAWGGAKFPGMCLLYP